MRLVRFSLFVMLSLVLIKCKSPSDEIDKAFKTVNSSLVTSNLHLSSVADSIYAEINANRAKNESIALKADTLFRTTIETGKFLDSLKEVLHQKDPTGENIDIAMNVLGNPAMGSILENKLSAVYNHSLSSLVDLSKKASLDSIISLSRDVPPGTDWKKFYFARTPTVGAMTILNKFKYDYMDGTVLVLTDINNHLH